MWILSRGAQGLLPGSTLLGNGPYHGSTPCEVLPEKNPVLSEAFSWTTERKKDTQNQQRQKAFPSGLRISLDRLCEFWGKQASASLSWGRQGCHTSWACKKARACGHGIYHCFWHRLKQSRERSSLPYSGPLHITLCTYLRSKTSKTHNPDSETKAPPSNKQNQNNTNQNYFFFVFLRAGIKKRKRIYFWVSKLINITS